jgi:hypothetical protein
MVIDAHAHLGVLHRFRADTERLIALADRAGIAKLVCSHLTAILYDMREGNRELTLAMRRYPERLSGYVAISSARYGQEALDELERGVHDYGKSWARLW